MQTEKEPVIKWHPLPPEGRVKINVDAHVVARSSWFSCGSVLRDHEGTFTRARTHRFARVVPIVEAEAKAVMEATRKIHLVGLQNVESDSLITVQAINNALENYLEVSVLFQE